jgi:hypothetical protein
MIPKLKTTAVKFEGEQKVAPLPCQVGSRRGDQSVNDSHLVKELLICTAALTRLPLVEVVVSGAGHPESLAKFSDRKVLRIEINQRTPLCGSSESMLINFFRSRANGGDIHLSRWRRPATGLSRTSAAEQKIGCFLAEVLVIGAMGRRRVSSPFSDICAFPVHQLTGTLLCPKAADLL